MKQVIVTVTQDDINKGEKRMPEKCALGLAWKRCYPGGSSVGYFWAHCYDEICFSLPQDAVDFHKAFDKGKRVFPTTFVFTREETDITR